MLIYDYENKKEIDDIPVDAHLFGFKLKQNNTIIFADILDGEELSDGDIQFQLIRNKYMDNSKQRYYISSFKLSEIDTIESISLDHYFNVKNDQEFELDYLSYLFNRWCVVNNREGSWINLDPDVSSRKGTMSVYERVREWANPVLGYLNVANHKMVDWNYFSQIADPKKRKVGTNIKSMISGEVESTVGIISNFKKEVAKQYNFAKQYSIADVIGKRQDVATVKCYFYIDEKLPKKKVGLKEWLSGFVSDHPFDLNFDPNKPDESTHKVYPAIFPPIEIFSEQYDVWYTPTDNINDLDGTFYLYLQFEQHRSSPDPLVIVHAILYRNQFDQIKEV